jgi:hypothetical protein
MRCDVRQAADAPVRRSGNTADTTSERDVNMAFARRVREHT